MRRACDVCGEEYEAKRLSSKFCGVRCRNRKHRGAAVAQLPSPPGTTGDVENAARRELEEAGRLDSVAGQGALALARRVDASQDTGQGLASVVKQLHATMQAALANVEEGADPIDELRAWRDRKRLAAR